MRLHAFYQFPASLPQTAPFLDPPLLQRPCTKR